MAAISDIFSKGIEKVTQRACKPAESALAPKAAAAAFGADTLLKSEIAFDRTFNKPVAQMSDAELHQFVEPIVLREAHDPAVMPSLQDMQAFKATMKTNHPAELQALKTLNPKERATFQTLRGQMFERADGQLALQQLLLDGRLTVGSAQTPARNLITALGDLGKRKLDPSIDRQTLLAQLHQELADPVAISQMHKGTCAATAHGQIPFSIRKPTDYTDFVANLASPEGKATMPNGLAVKRASDWRSGNDRIPTRDMIPGTDTNPERTLTSKLTEPVFMQVGIGKEYRYSNTFDQGMGVKAKADKKIAEGGLGTEQSSRLLEAIFPGENYTSVYTSRAEAKQGLQWYPDWKGTRGVMNKNQMLDYLRGSAAPESPVPVGVNYQLDGGHALAVTAVRDVAVKGRGVPAHTESWVNYINPWGREETQRADAFQTVLDGLNANGSVPGVKV
jgi:hypothetical protein